MRRITYTWSQVHEMLRPIDQCRYVVYGIPKTGMLLSAHLIRAGVTSNPDEANLFLDDVIDSGATRVKYAERFPITPFVALIDKPNDNPHGSKDSWIVWPWEEERGEDAPHDAVVRLLEYIGEDPRRDGLKETPKRVTKALKELTLGYEQDPAVILAKRFHAEQVDEMVVVRDIPFSSLCEHHMLPFHGHASVAYIPGDGNQVVGLSKIPRLVNCFAKRLQMQERMTAQIVNAIMEHLAPLGAGCMITAHHTCMSIRGVGCTGNMTTSALRGVFKTDPQTRSEFLGLVHS